MPSKGMLGSQKTAGEPKEGRKVKRGLQKELSVLPCWRTLGLEDAKAKLFPTYIIN